MTTHLTETDFLKAWAIFIVCTISGWFGVAIIAGAVLGGMLGLAGASGRAIEIAGSFAGYATGLPVSYVCFRFFVRRLLIQKVTA